MSVTAHIDATGLNTLPYLSTHIEFDTPSQRRPLWRSGGILAYYARGRGFDCRTSANICVHEHICLYCV
jgi:hypothetical protein